MNAIFLILLILAGLVAVAAIFTAYLAAEARAVVPRKGKMTSVPGGKIHWVESGAGRPLVMIHGLGGNLRNFTYSLSEKLEDDFRVIAIDRPGCGWSTRDSEDQATLMEQARMVSDFIKAEGLENPLIVGHSLGGAIGVVMGLNHAEGLGGLVLICPATQPIPATPDAFKGIDIASPLARRIIAYTLASPMSLVMQEKVFAEVFKPEAISPDFGPKGGAALGRTPESFIAASEDLNGGRKSASEIEGRESELALPIGILYAEGDNILDPSLHGTKFAELTGADLKMLPGRGHMIPLTAPDDCADYIRHMAAKTA